MSGTFGRVGWACPKKIYLGLLDFEDEGTAIRETLATVFVYNRHEVASRNT